MRTPPNAVLSPRSLHPAVLRGERGGGPLARVLDGFLVVGCLLLVAIIALLDYATGPDLSLSLFYLVPVAVCAWWGGFAHGILLSLAGAVAWHTVERLECPTMPAAAEVWNGIVLFGTLVLVSSLVSRLHAGVLRERLLARTDPLTGAANGRTFYETAAVEAGRARRTGRPLTLAYLDLDNFKQLNDRLGHAAGDAALLHVVQTIQPGLRNGDVLARLGGDEFALLLPETDGEGGDALLRRLQEQLAREMDRKGWAVSLSIGAITFLQPCGDLDLMIGWVDSLMYESKRKGKGRVEHAVLGLGQELERRAERRATARVLCEQAVRVRPDGTDGTDEVGAEFATVRDVSLSGIGLVLDKPFPCGTLLVIEPMLPGPPALLARVVHSTQEEGRWKHGCELSARLGDDELRRWLAGRAEARVATTWE